MKMKYLCFVLLLAWVAGACSKDDDDDKGGQKNDDRFTKRKVSRIYASSGWEEGYNLKFEYNEQGEIAKIRYYWDSDSDWDDVDYEFTFTENEVRTKEFWYYDNSSFIIIRPLNERRYVARCTTGLCNYDAEGHLLTTGRDTLVWKAGNLVNGNLESGIEYDQYEYTDIENKANLDFAMAIYYKYYLPDEGYGTFLYALGYYGKTNRNLLARSRYCTYSYKFDNKGYVVEFTEKATPQNEELGGPTTYRVEYYD